MRVGRRIFFDTTNGNVILDTGEKSGLVSATTPEQDIETFTALSERNAESFDYVDLEYGELASEFLAAKGFTVDLATKEILFVYPDPANPEVEPEPVKPLTTEITSLKTGQAQILLKLMRAGIK